MIKRSTFALEIAAIVLPPFILIWQIVTRLQAVALLSLVGVIAANFVMVLLFERQKPSAANLMPLVVLATMATVGRLLFGPVANFKPMAAVTIVAGMSFGRLPGYTTGALSILMSNLFFGQGSWTPWQMFSFGLIGWFAGLFSSRDWLTSKFALLIFGFTFAFFSTMLLDLWFLAGFVSPITPTSVLAAFVAGFYFNLSHGIATVLFLLPIQGTWTRGLKRIAKKYGIT